MSQPGEKGALLQVEGLSKRFELERAFTRRVSDWWQGKPAPFLEALNNVSFSVKEEEVLGILGESGSGKSTLARILMGLYAPESGRAWLNGKDLLSQDRAERLTCLRNMQIIFQDPFSSLDPRMTVRQILLEPLQIHGLDRAGDSEQKLLKGVHEVGLEADVLDRYPSEFSGGQRQRIGICRALILEPALLIADEAVSALDVSVQAQILELLTQLRKNRQLSMIFISHDVAVIRQLSDRVLVLFQGRVVEIMPAECLLGDACHPYSRRLLGAALRLREGTSMGTALSSPEGTQTSPDAGEGVLKSQGCPFRSGCPDQNDRCEIAPPMLSVHPQHEVACWCFGKNPG